MRLTVLQVTGLDGNYRITCHTVMEVLREHRDSVMAVLEAFVYDPLLNWRLMDSKRSSAVDLQYIRHGRGSSKGTQTTSTSCDDRQLDVNRPDSVK